MDKTSIHPLADYQCIHVIKKVNEICFISMPDYRNTLSKHIATYCYWGFFACLVLLGFWGCLGIGVGADEEAERATLAINLAAISGIFSGNLSNYQALLAHPDRYYGIGFHLPSLLISHVYQSICQHLEIAPPISNPMIFSHLSVWASFVGAALLMRKLFYQISGSDSLSLMGMLCFMLWPYLLGHGLMNIKDMPFLFSWLLCTVIALPLAQATHGNSPRSIGLSTGRWIALGLATAWLLSIRISGVLIFIEYGCLFFSAWYFSDHRVAAKDLFQTIISQKNVLSFTIVFALALIALYPVTWTNPLELFHAISYMSHHPWVGTTLTAGRFIAPSTNLYFYLPVWLLAKLPAIAIVGLALSPWIFFRTLGPSKAYPRSTSFATAILFGLALSALTIMLALVVMRVGLYNELRQTLFLFPLLFLIGVTCLYWLNKKIAFAGLIITSAIFIWDNLVLYPYNYSYLNEVARQRPAIQYFETDYFGFSAGRSARWLTGHPQWRAQGCIYAWPPHLLTYELDRQYYSCLLDSQGNAFNIPKDKPSLLYISQRNLINFPIPAQCQLIQSEERILPLSKNPLIMGRLFRCN